MIVTRNISSFVVFEEDSVLTGLTKLNANKQGIIFVVEPSGLLVGVVTDGDFRRWLTSSAIIDLQSEVRLAMNKDFVCANQADSPSSITAKLNARIKAVPIVDAQFRIVSIAQAGSNELSINGRPIGSGHPAYLIAEIGNNHNGSVELACRLVDLAVEAGVDCAKFQMRDMKSLYGSETSGATESQDLGAQYTLDLLAKYNLPPESLFHVFDYTRTKGIEPLCTPWDLASLHALEEYGIRGYKIASADLTNHELLAAIANTGKPIIASTGMATDAEIRESVSLLQALGASYALLHTNSTYPAPYKDINLKYMDRLAAIGECPVGYSGHERGWVVAAAAVSRGATIIEKHFTTDRSLEGNDHRVSLLPDELKEMVAGIRAIEESLGVDGDRILTQGEMMNREVLAKSLHATRDISVGDTITSDMIIVRSPGTGLQPNRQSALVGIPAIRNIKAQTPFFPTDIGEGGAVARNYTFRRPWGLPVRWHDYGLMLRSTNLDLLEYHLSYRDMEVSLESVFTEPMDVDLVVHAPELFAADHILDLASPDQAYWERSISELQRVVDITNALKPWHLRAVRPLIITNIGGFSRALPLPSDERPSLYRRVEDALSRIDAEGVEIIAQTMPPFPWHFGGQSYHNLFMDPDEIENFCVRNGSRVCLDVSHSQLACNQHHWSMKDFCAKVGPFAAHLHIVDAKGVDGEGLQIGEGNMDFAAIAAELDRVCPSASFVPEIWQGHKNDGAGFWYALDKLEKWF